MMRFKKNWVIALLAALVLVLAGCMNTEDNGTEDPETDPNNEDTEDMNGDSETDEGSDNEPNEDQSYTWETYENERFYFTIDYPESWTFETAQNNDGITFLPENQEQDIRVYGAQYLEETSTPYANADHADLSQEEVTLTSGVEATIIEGEADGVYHYEMVVVENGLEYHFVSKTTPEYYQENQEVIQAMVESFAILEDALEEDSVTLTEEKAFEIEDQFFDMLYTPETVGRTNEIENYQNKEALIDAVSEIANRSLAAEHVEGYYREEEGALYVVPTEGPAQLLADSPVEINEIDRHTYEVIQEEENALRGAYTLTVEFSWVDGQWKITDRTIVLDN
ncbi:hypothetical protein [Streptohalobacillus salinus]|nr:hypothetical protein [Streptohalobacillus salinus]